MFRCVEQRRHVLRMSHRPTPPMYMYTVGMHTVGMHMRRCRKPTSPTKPSPLGLRRITSRDNPVRTQPALCACTSPYTPLHPLCDPFVAVSGRLSSLRAPQRPRLQLWWCSLSSIETIQPTSTRFSQSSKPHLLSNSMQHQHSNPHTPISGELAPQSSSRLHRKCTITRSTLLP